MICMINKNSTKNNEYDKLLNQALKNPRVQEVSKLYDSYNEIAKQMSSIESSMHKRSTIITSNSST